MEFSPQQQDAIDKFTAWDRSGNYPIFRLFGYAGTGKTTLARHLAEQVGGAVIFASFTGKAAAVMREKGCRDARTLHGLIYLPRGKSEKRLQDLEEKLRNLKSDASPAMRRMLQRSIEAERENLKRPSFVLNTESELRQASLLVVDEVSMVDGRMGDDIMSFRRPVLCLGDTAQLPPVRGSGFFMGEEPDVLLTEVHRHAADSPVFQLATMARGAQRLQSGDYGGSRVVPKGVLSIEEVVAHDQVIVGTNRSRRNLNRQIRRHMGRDNPLPEPGDKLVCVKNNHEQGFLNGTQWSVLDADVLDDHRIGLTVTDGEWSRNVEAHREYFEGREREISPWSLQEAVCFEHGYAMTCHKAQGSQWDSVLVIDQSSRFGDDRHKWLYTAVTRAAKAVTVVQT